MRHLFRTALAFLALAPAVLAGGRPGKAAASPAKPKMPFAVHEFKLENGLKVLLVERRGVPAVTFWTFYRVGSRNEKVGTTGIAHYFEHMMFNGGKKYGPGEFDVLLEGAGGSSNAFTNNDITAYYEDYGPRAMDIVLDLEVDRMGYLEFDPEVMESEREVVKSERRLRTDNDIQGMLYEHLEAAMFMAHPYHWPVIGWMADLNNINREDCLSFFRTYYAPNNCVMLVIGDFDKVALEQKIRDTFGPLPAGPPAREVIRSEPPQMGERRVTVHYPAETGTFLAGWHAPEASHGDAPALQVLASILADGPSSRLQKRMQFDDTLATGVEFFYETRIDPGFLGAGVEMVPGRTVAEGEAALYAELDRVVKDGVTAQELAKARNKLRTAFWSGLTTNNGIGRVLGSAEVYLGGWQKAFDEMEQIDRVTAADVQRVAGLYLKENNRTVAVLVPEAEQPEEGEEAP